MVFQQKAFPKHSYIHVYTLLHLMPKFCIILISWACPIICSYNQCGQLNCQNQLQLLMIRNTTVVSICNHCRLRQHNDTVNKGIGQQYNYCYIVLYRYHTLVGGSVWYVSSEVVINFDSLKLATLIVRANDRTGSEYLNDAQFGHIKMHACIYHSRLNFLNITRKECIQKHI